MVLMVLMVLMVITDEMLVTRSNLRKLSEKDEAEKELKRLKNLQREEMKSKLQQLAEVAGNGVDLDELAAALEGDFDADTFTAKMEAAFAAAYSDADDDYDPHADGGLNDLVGIGSDDDDDVAGGYGGRDDGDDDDDDDDDDDNGKVDAKPSSSAKHVDSVKKQMAAMVPKPSSKAAKAVKGAPLPFMYRKVQANDYGLTAAEILELEDNQLNQCVACLVVLFDMLRAWLHRVCVAPLQAGVLEEACTVP